jgi:hypothetical protein
VGGEQELIEDVIRLIDEGVVVDRSQKPISPIVTLVGSARNKERADEASRFVAELQRKHPYARLKVSEKSPVEKSAIEMAGLIDMPCDVVKAGKKGEWDEGPHILDERCVAGTSHVVAFDSSSRSEQYRKLAARTGKFFQQV